MTQTTQRTLFDDEDPIFPPVESFPQSMREEWCTYILSEEFQSYIMALHRLRKMLLDLTMIKTVNLDDIVTVNKRLSEATTYRRQLLSFVRSGDNTQYKYILKTTKVSIDKGSQNTGAGRAVKSCLRKEGPAKRGQLSVTFNPVDNIRIIPARQNATANRRLPKRGSKKRRSRKPKAKVPHSDPLTNAECVPMRKVADTQIDAHNEKSNHSVVSVTSHYYPNDSHFKSVLADCPPSHTKPLSPPPPLPPLLTDDKVVSVSSHIDPTPINTGNLLSDFIYNKKYVPDQGQSTTTTPEDRQNRHRFRFWLNRKTPSHLVSADQCTQCTTGVSSPPQLSKWGELEQSECQTPPDGHRHRRIRAWLKLR